MLFVVLPKFALGVSLWWFGARYVAMSPDNSELILNTVAVLFVLEIDDQLYRVTVPARYRWRSTQASPRKGGKSQIFLYILTNAQC